MSKSSAKAFPSKLRQKLSAVQTIDAEDLGTEAKISQKCPECGAKEMWFYTLQLRSADEGVSTLDWPGGEGRCDGGNSTDGCRLRCFIVASVGIGSIRTIRRMRSGGGRCFSGVWVRVVNYNLCKM